MRKGGENERASSCWKRAPGERVLRWEAGPVGSLGCLVTERIAPFGFLEWYACTYFYKEIEEAFPLQGDF